MHAAFYGIQRSGYFLKASSINNYYKNFNFLSASIKYNECLIELTSIIQLYNVGFGKLESLVIFNLHIEHSHIQRMVLNVDGKEVYEKNYNSNISALKNEISQFNVTTLEIMNHTLLHIRLYIKNDSLKQFQLKIFLEKEKTVIGIDNVVFASPSLSIGKSDFDLAYNDELLVERSHHIDSFTQIFYLLVVLVVLSFILTSTPVKTFIYSKLLIRDRNKQSIYENTAV